MLLYRIQPILKLKRLQLEWKLIVFLTLLIACFADSMPYFRYKNYNLFCLILTLLIFIQFQARLICLTTQNKYHQKHPERVKPPQNITINIYTAKITAKTIRSVAFQFLQIISCLTVFAELLRSSDNDAICYVFLTKIQIFSPRLITFCKSSFTI